MAKGLAWTRNALALVGVLALGFWLGAGRTVRASSDNWNAGNLEFQLAGVDPHSSLLVYQPERRTVYVYQGATTGNAELQCSFMFELDRPGGVIHRRNCAVGQLIP